MASTFRREALNSRPRNIPLFITRPSMAAGCLIEMDNSPSRSPVCVMHHVPLPQWTSFALRTGGLALAFGHNPYNPATQYIVKTCDIDKDAVLLRRRKTARDARVR
jgi:hypothetical protein